MPQAGQVTFQPDTPTESKGQVSFQPDASPSTSLTGHAKALWDDVWKGRIPLSKLSKPLADHIQKQAEHLSAAGAIKGGAGGKYMELSGEMQAFFAHAIESGGKLAESQTSYGNALLWASGLGEARAVAKGLEGAAAMFKALRIGAGTAFAAEGAKAYSEGKTFEEKAFAVAQMAGGGAMAHPGAISHVPGETAPPRAIPKPTEVPEFGSKATVKFPKGVSPVPGRVTFEPLATPTGQRKIGPLPEDQSGVTEPTAPGARGARPAPGQRELPTLPEGSAGLPEPTAAPPRAGFGLRARAPGEPLTEVQGPAGPKVIRPTSKAAPFQKSLADLPKDAAGLPPRAKGVSKPPKPIAATIEATKTTPPASNVKPGALKLEATAEQQIPAAWMPHFETLHADARANGFTGTRTELAETFVDRLQRSREASDEFKALSGQDQHVDLLKAIARAGGFGIDVERGSAKGVKGPTLQGGMVGELESMLEGLSMQRGKTKSGKLVPREFIQAAGLKSEGITGIVRRKGGQSVDRIMEAIKQDPQFAHLAEGSMADFLEHVQTAIQIGTGQREAPGVRGTDIGDILEGGFNVKPGTRWWDQGGAVEDTASEAQLQDRVVERLKAAGVSNDHLGVLKDDITSSVALFKQQLHQPGASIEDVYDSIDEYAAIKAEHYWSEEHMPDLMAGPADVLATGELQPRLPGETGAVRDLEVKQPELERPPDEFRLSGGSAKSDEFQPDMFPGFPGGKAELHGGLGAVQLPKAVMEWVEGKRESAKAVTDTVRGWAAPTKITEAATRTADALSQVFADLANQEDIRRAAGVKTFKAWRQVPEDLQIKGISEYERTGRFPQALDPDGSYAKAYSDSMNLAHEWLREGFKNDALGYVENYVRHAFDMKPGDVKSAGRILSEKVRTSLSANKSVSRRRALAMPLEDALDTLAKKGIKAKLLESNPERLRQWAVNNAYRALRFRQLGNYLTREKLVRYVAKGSDPPTGWTTLEDPRFQAYFKSDKGLVAAGEYWADPHVARILDRAVSVGYHNPVYDFLRGSNLIWNQLNLGFSAFHATETAINAGASEVARAIQAFGRGEIVRGLKSTGLSATMVGPAIRDFYNGREFQNAVRNGDPAALQTLHEVFNPAGGRLAIEKRYMTHFYDHFQKAWADGQPFKAGMNLLGAIPQIIAKPLMEHTIPKIKLGAFLDLATDIQRRMPNAGFADRQRAYRLAWDAIDDRFGLLTHDNLFWSKKASDIAQLSIRSVGWSFGTVRSFGGAVFDVAEGLKAAGKGQGSKAAQNLLSDRVAFALALPSFVAMAGIWYQYLHTGKLPQDRKDYFYPRNGGTTANGDPDRGQIKSYLSDIVNYSKDPVTTAYHKTSPELEGVVSILMNQNFFGDLVHNWDDPWGVQAQQVGQFLLESFQPFSMQQITGAMKQGTSGAQSIERGFGIQKAPAWAIQTPLENEIVKTERHRMGERHRTPEEVETDHVRQEAALEFKQAQTADERKAILARLLQTKVITSSQQFLAFIRRVEAPVTTTWYTLPIADRIRLEKLYPDEVQQRGLAISRR